MSLIVKHAIRSEPRILEDFPCHVQIERRLRYYPTFFCDDMAVCICPGDSKERKCEGVTAGIGGTSIYSTCTAGASLIKKISRHMKEQNEVPTHWQASDVGYSVIHQMNKRRISSISYQLPGTH